MLTFLRTTVWPHASKVRTNTLRAVLYKEPFRTRTPRSLSHHDSAWVLQVMSANDARWGSGGMRVRAAHPTDCSATFV